MATITQVTSAAGNVIVPTVPFVIKGTFESGAGGKVYLLYSSTSVELTGLTWSTTSITGSTTILSSSIKPSGEVAQLVVVPPSGGAVAYTRVSLQPSSPILGFVVDQLVIVRGANSPYDPPNPGNIGVITDISTAPNFKVKLAQKMTDTLGNTWVALDTTASTFNVSNLSIISEPLRTMFNGQGDAALIQEAVSSGGGGGGS